MGSILVPWKIPHSLEQLSPYTTATEAWAPRAPALQWKAAAMRSPCIALQLEKACTQQQRPSTIIQINKYFSKCHIYILLAPYLWEWRRKRLPSPVFWPGEFHGLYSLWGHRESDTTEKLWCGNTARIYYWICYKMVCMVWLYFHFKNAHEILMKY